MTFRPSGLLFEASAILPDEIDDGPEITEAVSDALPEKTDI